MVTDLDGTLWETSDALPMAHFAAISQVRQMGVPVLAATARRPRHVLEPFASMDLDLPFACLDGAIGFDGDAQFVDRAFSKQSMETCLDVLRDSDLSPCLYVLDGHSDIVVTDKPSTCSAHQEFIAAHSRTLSRSDSVSSLRSTRW